MQQVDLGHEIDTRHLEDGIGVARRMIESGGWTSGIFVSDGSGNAAVVLRDLGGVLREYRVEDQGEPDRDAIVEAIENGVDPMVVAVDLDPFPLVKGATYDLDRIELVGWLDHGQPVEGYRLLAYFEGGRYLGADADGVEPLVRLIR